MRRPWWTRLAAGVLAVWLALVLGESGLVLVCPAHDRIAPAAHAASGAHGAMAGMAHVNAVDRHGDLHGGHGTPTHEHAGCTCIGCCTASTPLALLVPRAPTMPVAVALVARARLVATTSLLPRPGPEHARPHTTGPPRV
jgi:hypothetical protein